MRERPIACRALVALAASLAFSCTRPNPLYHPDDASAGGAGGGSNGGAGGKGGAGGADAGAETGGACTPGAMRACYTGTQNTNMLTRICHGGNNYCVNGAWQQACVGEVIDQAESCNGLDDNCNGTADDGFPAISCGLGRCATTATPGCAAGAVVACTPSVAPIAEICGNGIDEDCDGAPDDDCAAPTETTLRCVHVSALTGDDTTADGTAALPFATIQAAIAKAPTLALTAVCVAGGATCSSPVTYQLAASTTIAMASGISVYGNYETTGWTRCPFGAGTSAIVTIAPGTTTGIQFSSSITARTVLDGVRIARLDQGDATAAVTVDGAKQVGLSNLFIDDAPSVAASTYGVDIKNGATVTITQSAILAGAGAVEAVGVRSIGATPTIRDNCSNVVGGTCMADCSQPLGIHGRPAAATAVGSSSAVLLRDSPGATVDRNTLCGGPAAEGDALRIAGTTAGGSAGIAVRANTVIASGATVEAHGIRIDACAGAAPWIAGNALIQADAAMPTANLSAVGVKGACNPVIDHNRLIAGIGEVGKGLTSGIACDGSPCVISGNTLVEGATSTHATQGIAVFCTNGGCAHVSDNILNGMNGNDVVGLSLDGGQTLVERNVIDGGCGHVSAVGVLASDTSAFIVNNVVQAVSCTGTLPIPSAPAGVRMGLKIGNANEAEVHSNTIVVGGSGGCVAAAATVFEKNGATGPYSRGIFRNNILRASGCAVAYDFREETSLVTPRLVESNELDPTPAPAPTLYSANMGGVSQVYTEYSLVNRLPGKMNNRSEDPMFAGFPANLQLLMKSLCVGNGTNLDAPATDFNRNPRVSPDIGAYEYQGP